jgi:hypothetical protein
MPRLARALSVLTSLAVIGAWGGTTAPAHAQAGLEYSVKAQYLVRFAAFVEWPPQAFVGPAAPVSICVVGRDPFGAALPRAAASQSAHGRPLTVATRTRAQGVGGCHIVYVGAGGEPALAGAPVQPTLWVTDAAVGSRRGVIHFELDQNRVRFHVNQGAANAQRLTISSRLLNLASSVRGARS